MLKKNDCIGSLNYHDNKFNALLLTDNASKYKIYQYANLSDDLRHKELPNEGDEINQRMEQTWRKADHFIIF